MAQKTFTRKLVEKGFERYKSMSKRKWRGIRPLSEDDEFYNFTESDTSGDSDTKSSKLVKTPYACEKVSKPPVTTATSVTLQENPMELDQFRGGK